MRSRLALSTAYSLLFSPVTVDVLFDRLHAIGVEQVALTDRDNLYGYPAYREAAQERGMSLICAALLTEEQGEIFAFVQNQTGYELLCRLISERNLNPSFSYLSLLQGNSTGLTLATTSKDILSLLAPTGADLYGAITPDSLQIMGTAKKLSVPLLALDAAFLLEESQREVHQVLRAIALHTSVGSLPEEAYRTKGGLLLEQPIWEQMFAPWPEAVHNAEALIPYDPFPTSHIFPAYPTNAYNTEVELRERVYTGAEKRYGEVSDAIRERIDYELTIINEKGFAPYFLVMHDIVQMSSRTCGRGSAAASIVSYSLFITNIDPIAYHLYFERFLSPSRSDPPDIDVDFAWDERDGVFAAIFKRFGIEHCARVANHNRFRPRSALRETARCYGLSDSQITKAEETLFTKGSAALLDPLWQTISRIATELNKLPKEISMHCGGLVITPKPVTCYAPILRSSDGYPLLSWEKERAEQAGFVKIDLLGNRSLAVVRDTLQNLREEGVDIDERTWQPTEDQATIAALARGDSMGVFYIESPAMRQLQKKTGRGDFAHIVIHSSLIRPAANKYINEYVQRLKGKKWEPLHPRLAYILDETYGILCYQEDVSKTAVALAGLSQSDADQLRKVIAKKAGGKHLLAFRELFFSGCKKLGVTRSVTEQIWLMMLSFDGYSFCKPHSASYAMVSFQSAYLRVHHPAHFMAAVLSNQGGYYRPQAYISEARRMGIIVEGPDINKSNIVYRAQGNTLVVGLMA
ncbi:MAG: PHP domain-containing protein, partial [Sphaerochaetaceae bacterium]